MNISRPKKIALIFGIVFLIFLYYYITFHGSIKAFVVFIDSCNRLFCDFSQYYYRMGKRVLIEPFPVAGFYYSPIIALLFSFWRFLPREEAVYNWGFVQALAIILLAAVWMHSVQKRKFTFRLLYLFLVLTAIPVVHNFKAGQVSVLISLCLLSALELYEANRKIASSLLLSFGAIFKFYPLILLFYFFFIGDYVFLILCAFFLFLLGIAIPAWFIGLKPTIHFYFAAFDSAATRFSLATGRMPGINALYFPLVAMRYFGEFNNPAWLPLLQTVSFLFIGANLFLVLLIAASEIEYRNYWAFLILLASTPFFVVSSWAHYFIYLPAFQVFLFYVIKKDKHRYWKYPILFASIFLSSVFLSNLFAEWRFYAYWGFLAWANLLALFLAYAELIPQLSLREAINNYREKSSAAMNGLKSIYGGRGN
jgi:hypothetical protein